MIHAYHPETQANLAVTEEQLMHMRASGWMTRAEHDENEAAKQPKAKPAAKDEGK